LVAVAAAVGWNLVNLRAETYPVSYLNDSSVHEQMVRFATAQFQSGRLPLTHWFPYLGLGSPQFLHYQSLGAMLAGALGLLIGPDAAFRWSLYILLSAWPIVIYAAARLFDAQRPAAAAAAVMAPFVMSATGVGYEQKAYVWIGYGVWAQLWASWTLPFAWGFTWRAIRNGDGYLRAAVLIALTIALHYETGYLALLPLFVWPLMSRRALPTRVVRGVIVGAAAVCLSAWVIIPLIAERNWAATNEALVHTPFVNGYGAGRILSWLFSGQLLDAGRLPAITLAAGVGVCVACARWKNDDAARALLVLLAGCLVLTFGRATWGPLVEAIPGSRDLFFRRFVMGDQLVLVLLAGWGASWCGLYATRLLRRVPGSSRQKVARYGDVLVVSVGGMLLIPALLQIRHYDTQNAAAIATQQKADHSQGVDLDRLVAVVRREGGGRVYAGMPHNWGARFTVGAVPVFKYLEARDVDEVGYTLRTASPMSGPEYYFDDRDSADYELFGLTYVILPFDQRPLVGARLTSCSAIYCLWRINGGNYLSAGAIDGAIRENRTDIGIRSRALLRTSSPDVGFVQVAFPGVNAASGPVIDSLAGRQIDSVLSETTDLSTGRANGVVQMRRPGVAVLSSSFDPGWVASVDGHPEHTQMIAPALVGVAVPAGVHRVAFMYHGYENYPTLLAIAGLCLAVLVIVCAGRRRGWAGDAGR
jgi:hypothetical protein